MDTRGPDNVTKAKAHARRETESGLADTRLAGEMPQREEDAWEPCFAHFLLSVLSARPGSVMLQPFYRRRDDIPRIQACSVSKYLFKTIVSHASNWALHMIGIVCM